MIQFLFGCLVLVAGTDTTRPNLSDSTFLSRYAAREMSHVEEMLNCKTEDEFYTLLKSVELNSLTWRYLPFFHPVSRRDLRYTSLFGYRLHPLTGRYQLHKGVDIGTKCQTLTYASGGGFIKQTGWDQYLGWFVRINHGFNWSSVYGHLSKIQVKVGQKIIAGQLIGESGSTGKSTGCHLHYGIYFRGIAVEPVRYFKVLSDLLSVH